MRLLNLVYSSQNPIDFVYRPFCAVANRAAAFRLVNSGGGQLFGCTEAHGPMAGPDGGRGHDSVLAVMGRGYFTHARSVWVSMEWKRDIPDQRGAAASLQRGFVEACCNESGIRVRLLKKADRAERDGIRRRRNQISWHVPRWAPAGNIAACVEDSRA